MREEVGPAHPVPLCQGEVVPGVVCGNVFTRARIGFLVVGIGVVSIHVVSAIKGDGKQDKKRCYFRLIIWNASFRG